MSARTCNASLAMPSPGGRPSSVSFSCGALDRMAKVLFSVSFSTYWGDYATCSRPETFLRKQGDGIPNDVAALAGARYVIALEPDEGRHLAESLIKGMTGTQIQARFLNREFFTFTPQFKLFIGTNHKPVIRGTDHGMWRRVRCVPFTVTIPDEEQDDELLDKLNAEREGILRWMVEGCLQWQRDGLGGPLEVQEATQAYRTEQDVLGSFLGAECDFVLGAACSKKELYARYATWCEEGGERHMLSNREFCKLFRERGDQRVTEDQSMDLEKCGSGFV